MHPLCPSTSEVVKLISISSLHDLFTVHLFRHVPEAKHAYCLKENDKPCPYLSNSGKNRLQKLDCSNCGSTEDWEGRPLVSRVLWAPVAAFPSVPGWTRCCPAQKEWALSSYLHSKDRTNWACCRVLQNRLDWWSGCYRSSKDLENHSFGGAFERRKAGVRLSFFLQRLDSVWMTNHNPEKFKMLKVNWTIMFNGQ